MGTPNSEKSLLRRKVIILLVSLILTGVLMRIFSPENKLDSRFYYTYQEVIFYLEGLPEIQKRHYLWAQCCDFWFMINYTWLFFLGFKKYSPGKKVWISFIPGILDFFETGLIVLYLYFREFNSAHQLLPMISSAQVFF